jgi:hypothetical protein
VARKEISILTGEVVSQRDLTKTLTRGNFGLGMSVEAAKIVLVRANEEEVGGVCWG